MDHKRKKIQKKDKDMNKILNTVFINADYQKRNCPDKSRQIAFENTLGLGETTSIAIKLYQNYLLRVFTLSWFNRLARSKRLMKSHSIKVLME